MDIRDCKTINHSRRSELFSIVKHYPSATIINKLPESKQNDTKSLIIWLDAGVNSTRSNSKLIEAYPESDTAIERIVSISIPAVCIPELVNAIAGDTIEKLQKQINETPLKIEKRRVGRPDVYSNITKSEIRLKHGEGSSIRKLAEEYHMSTRTVQKICSEKQ